MDRFDFGAVTSGSRLGLGGEADPGARQDVDLECVDGGLGGSCEERKDVMGVASRRDGAGDRGGLVVCGVRGPSSKAVEQLTNDRRWVRRRLDIFEREVDDHSGDIGVDGYTGGSGYSLTAVLPTRKKPRRWIRDECVGG